MDGFFSKDLKSLLHRVSISVHLFTFDYISMCIFLIKIFDCI